MQRFNFVLPEYAVVYIAYGDSSHLEDDEQLEIDKFVAGIRNRCGVGHWDFGLERKLAAKNDINNVACEVVQAVYTIIWEGRGNRKV